MQNLRCGEMTPLCRATVLAKINALEGEVTTQMVLAQEEKEKAAVLRAKLDKAEKLLTDTMATEWQQKYQIASLTRVLEQLMKAQSDLGTDMQEAILDLIAGSTGSSATSLIGTLLVGSRMLSEQRLQKEQATSSTEPARQARRPLDDVRLGRRGHLAEAARGRAQWSQRSERWKCSKASVHATWPTTASPWTCRCGAVWTLAEPESSRSPENSDADSPSPRGTASSTDTHSPDGLASNADSHSDPEDAFTLRLSGPPTPPRPSTPPPVTDDLSRFVMA